MAENEAQADTNAQAAESDPSAVWIQYTDADGATKRVLVGDYQKEGLV